MRILYIERPRFGYLYKENAILSTKGLANVGWKVPSLADWQSLFTYVGGIYAAGNKLKEAGTVHWSETTTSVTNEYGLSLIAGGIRDAFGTYATARPGLLGDYATTTFRPGTSLLQWCQFAANYAYVQIMYDFVNLTPGAGMSVRLIANSTSLTNGQKGQYIGNDGLIYPTICINGVEWMTKNLMEGLFRDGSQIPIKASISDWVNDVGGARSPCSDDLTYV